MPLQNQMQQLYKQNAGQKVLKTPLWKLQNGFQKAKKPNHNIVEFAYKQQYG